ncbi:hypothetical protein PCE1_001322 [Barthelona sp. PCE]
MPEEIQLQEEAEEVPNVESTDTEDESIIVDKKRTHSIRSSISAKEDDDKVTMSPSLKTQAVENDLNEQLRLLEEKRRTLDIDVATFKPRHILTLIFLVLSIGFLYIMMKKEGIV